MGCVTSFNLNNDAHLRVEAKIVSSKIITPKNKLIRLRCCPSFACRKHNQVEFVAGQYLGLYPYEPDSQFFPGQYSVVSAPSDLPYVEVMVTNSENPRNLRHWLHRIARVGDKLWVDPVGYGTVAVTGKEMLDCPLAWNGGKGGICLLGGGSGISACISIIRHLCEEDHPVDIVFIHSNRNEDEIPFYDEMKTMEKENKNLKVIHTLTGASETWTGRKGRINEDLLLEFIPGKKIFCVFGSATFCTAIVSMLLDIGVWASCIRSDYSIRIDSSSKRSLREFEGVENLSQLNLNTTSDPKAEFLKANGMEKTLESLTNMKIRSCVRAANK